MGFALGNASAPGLCNYQAFVMNLRDSKPRLRLRTVVGTTAHKLFPQSGRWTMSHRLSSPGEVDERQGV